MSKISNIQAVAGAFDVPVPDLIDFLVGYGGTDTPSVRDTATLLDNRIAAAEHVNLHPQYITALKDAKKLLT